MRIAFVGKGGSGKTTIASLYAEFEVLNGKKVLALDADINQHLAAGLGYHGELRSLGLELDQVKAHLRGKNQRFSPEQMHKTTPPGNGSNFITLNNDDWFIKRYTQKSNGVLVAGAGEIPEGNVGVRCYHGLNGAVELVLGHMLDTKDEIVVVDMAAGADAFSSSLFAKVDLMVLVIEPTLKSLSVYDQFVERVANQGVKLLVFANKVQDASDLEFIVERAGVPVAAIGLSHLVKSRERGDTSKSLKSDKELYAQLTKLSQAIAKVPRNWKLLEERSHNLHIKNANEWMGKESLSHIDPNFSLYTYATESGY